jgi:hypothetical protein
VTFPAELPRLWPTIAVPGIAEGRATYRMLDLDAMPSVQPALDGSLSWLLREPPRRNSLERGPDDPVQRAADPDGLAAVASGVRVPPTFKRFIADPESRRRVRSATACYLDLGQFSVSVGDGVLVHFLSDQQWVLHWLLWAGPDGSEAVVVTPEPLGFDAEGEPVHSLDPDSPGVALAVCGNSFEEFLYRYWAMNELFFRLALDKVPVSALPPDLRAFAEAYPRDASAHDLFGPRA